MSPKGQKVVEDQLEKTSYAERDQMRESRGSCKRREREG